MNNPFIKRQIELRQRIISGFSGILVSSDEVQKGEDDLELEKAHKDGDMHPNGKWVWVSSANGGRGDWRTINGRIHQKHTAAQGGSGSSGSQGTSGGSKGTPKAEKPGQQAAKPKVDTTTIDDAEYKRMYAQAKSVDDESRSMGLGIINSNISKYKKDLEDTIAKRPGAKATIKQLQDKLTKFISQKKAAEDVIAELKKSTPKYDQMEIKDAKKALMGKVVTLKDYGSDGLGNPADMVGEITNVRKYGKNQIPIATISYPGGDTEDVRLSDIDNGKLSNFYNTPISVGTDATELNKIKKKIADNNEKQLIGKLESMGFKSTGGSLSDTLKVENENGMKFEISEDKNSKGGNWYKLKSLDDNQEYPSSPWYSVINVLSDYKDNKPSGTAKAAKTTTTAPQNVPHINLKSTAETIAYAKTLSDFTFKDEDSGFGKYGKAFSLTNKNGLKMTVDFVNDSEYVYDFKDKDGNSLYRISSTSYNNRTDWKDFLNPKTWSRKQMSELKSNISKYETASKSAKMRYDRYGKVSDYQKYLDNKSWAQNASRRLEKVKKIASLS